jgi:hypothetical protein
MTSRIAATGRVGRGISAAESTQSGGLPPSNDALRKVHPVLTFAASTKAGVAERDIMEYRAGIARRWRAAPPGREVIILLLGEFDPIGFGRTTANFTKPQARDFNCGNVARNVRPCKLFDGCDNFAGFGPLKRGRIFYSQRNQPNLSLPPRFQNCCLLGV